MELCYVCAAYFGFFINATAYYLGQYSLHLLLLKSSMWRLESAQVVSCCACNNCKIITDNSWRTITKVVWQLCQSKPSSPSTYELHGGSIERDRGKNNLLFILDRRFKFQFCVGLFEWICFSNLLKLLTYNLGASLKNLYLYHTHVYLRYY